MSLESPEYHHGAPLTEVEQAGWADLVAGFNTEDCGVEENQDSEAPAVAPETVEKPEEPARSIARFNKLPGIWLDGLGENRLQITTADGKELKADPLGLSGSSLVLELIGVPQGAPSRLIMHGAFGGELRLMYAMARDENLKDAFASWALKETQSCDDNVYRIDTISGEETITVCRRGLVRAGAAYYYHLAYPFEEGKLPEEILRQIIQGSGVAQFEVVEYTPRIGQPQKLWRVPVPRVSERLNQIDYLFDDELRPLLTETR